MIGRWEARGGGESEAARWAAGDQDEKLTEFGDRLVSGPHGPVFIHIPTRDEIGEDLAESGGGWERDALRSEIATESEDVSEFALECRFWEAVNPSKTQA
ncbi:MAG: hypothetical protein J6386_19345 [Candidatus Synoicihabitans palmerolidicus]|nr:hypothetical protein [Candidatus Synoicihabitans palmerolidicus]